MCISFEEKYWTKTVYPVVECKRTILYAVRFAFNHDLNKLSKLNDANKSVFISKWKKAYKY